jgi:hypothetical protein
MDYPAIEQGSTRPGRWLRERRVKIALWIAVIEGILVVVEVIPGWIALVVGVALVAFYFFVGRNLRQDTLRETSWMAALSQVFLAFVPVLMFIATVVAILALVVIAIVALVALFADRR